MPELYILTPKKSLSWLLPKSAVCASRTGDFMTLDFEGNLYNATNLQSYEQKLLHACSRHTKKYPTVARTTIPLKNVHELFHTVGTLSAEDLSYNLKQKKYTGSSDEDCVQAAWQINQPDILKEWITQKE